ncbi:MAG: HD domain-containing protein [Deltaproteobacteria bacterium]|nr:HD domain-containing protein [Deltaproteobacteria bacterium]
MDTLKPYKFFGDIINNGGEIYLVGGCVRDQLLNRPIKDIDLVVRLIPQNDLITLLHSSGYCNLVGKSFGVIKFKPRENPEIEIDISLPRTEVSTGTGHKDFNVKHSETLTIEADLLRRDFTINAMALHLTDHKLIDPFGGQDDLQSKIIRTVTDASFEEDPLRMLRAIQFAARFDFSIHPATLVSMTQHASLITTISPERIIIEIKKLFSAPKPSVGFDLMGSTGLLALICPDIENIKGIIQPRKKNEDVYTHTMKALDAARASEELTNPGNINTMLAALFHDTGKFKTQRHTDTQTPTFYNHHLVSAGIVWRWMKDYKVTTAGFDPEHIRQLVEYHMFETIHFKDNDKALRRFITKVGKDHIIDLLDLRLADKKGGRFPQKVYGIVKLREQIIEEINRKPPFTAKDLAINGHDIMALGFAAGRIIGDIQRFLMEKVLDQPELNTKEGLTSLIEDNKEALRA